MQSSCSSNGRPFPCTFDIGLLLQNSSNDSTDDASRLLKEMIHCAIKTYLSLEMKIISLFNKIFSVNPGNSMSENIKRILEYNKKRFFDFTYFEYWLHVVSFQEKLPGGARSLGYCMRTRRNSKVSRTIRSLPWWCSEVKVQFIDLPYLIKLQLIRFLDMRFRYRTGARFYC